MNQRTTIEEGTVIGNHREMTGEMTPVSENDAVPSGVTLIEVLTQLACRKRLIAAVTVVATALGVILSLILPVRYTSIARIMPPQQTQSAASMFVNQLASSSAAPLATLAGAGLGLKSPNDLYVGLLNSRPIADAIIQRFQLSRVYRAKDMTEARKELAKYSSVISEKNGLIVIAVKDRDKQRAADMANAYTQELRDLTKSLAVTEASQRRLFYQEQLRQAKDELISAQGELQRIQQQKGLVVLDAQAKAMIEGLSALRAQVAAKQVEVQARRSYSADHNPDLQLAERELSALQGEVTKLDKSQTGSTQSELAFKDLSSAGLDYLRADHEVKYRQALFDLLLKQYDAARLDEAKEAAVIQVVETAIAADRKSEPSRVVITLSFLGVGFLAGCMAALFQWWKELLRLDPIGRMQMEKLSSAFRVR
jgi:tyrosine-protein kinase Etk/Wzc